MRIIFMVKALMWVTIGPLAFGLLSPIFWTEHSEFSEKQKRIYALISSQDYYTSFFPLSNNLKRTVIRGEDSACKSKATSIREVALIRAAHRDEYDIMGSIYDAARMAESGYIERDMNRFREQLLSPMPSPLIGMLDACIHATLLSPLCVAGLRKRLNSISPAEMEEIKNESFKETNAFWCMTSEKLLGLTSKEPELVEGL